MAHQIILPRTMHIGKEASQRITETLASLRCSKPLLITDHMMVELGYAERIQRYLAEHSIALDVFSDTVPEPTVTSIAAGVEALRAKPYDCIIALGGGSPIGTDPEAE